MRRTDPSRSLRVAYIGHTGQPSGGELAFLHLIDQFGRLGLPIDPVVLLAEDGPLMERMTACGAQTEVLPLDDSTRRYRGRDLASFPVRPAVNAAHYAGKLARRLRQLEIDVVHTMSLKAALYGGVAGRLARRPVIWSIQDRIAADFIPPNAVRLVRAVARVLPKLIIANSEATAATLRGVRTPVRVVYPVVSPVSASPPEPGDGTLTFGVVGRLVPWKGQEVFLRAFARAFPDGQVRGRVVGGALFGQEPYAARMASLTRELGLAETVEMRGHRDNIAEEISNIDVLVHCSTLPEPFGMVIVEGMSAGRAVIAADAGGPREIIRAGVDGLLTAPGDVSALAGAMRRLADDPALRGRLAEAGQRRSAAFTGPASALAVHGCYQDVAP